MYLEIGRNRNVVSLLLAGVFFLIFGRSSSNQLDCPQKPKSNANKSCESLPNDGGKNPLSYLTTTLTKWAKL